MMILEGKKESMYLDANIIINCFFDSEYLQLLKNLKNKHNLIFLLRILLLMRFCLL